VRCISTTYLPRPGTKRVNAVALVPGEGIGPQFSEKAEYIFDELNIPIKLERVANDDIDKMKEYNVLLKGPIQHSMDKFGSRQIIAKELDMFAYAVHAFHIPGIETRHSKNPIDIVTIRESSEGEYSAIEHEVVPNVVESIKVITREKSLRIAQYAFEYAIAANRKKVTCIHKANIMKLCDGEFLQAARDVSKDFPTIKFEEMIVDATCMNMSLHPQNFDVMLLPNLYGSIIGSVAAGIVGGPGISPGCNIGFNHALFEQGARHCAEDLVDSRKANPTGYLLSVVMMLRHLKLPYFSDTI
jgi:isocitrate dehydrogenase (NAD+)